MTTYSRRLHVGARVRSAIYGWVGTVAERNGKPYEAHAVLYSVRWDHDQHERLEHIVSLVLLTPDEEKKKESA